MAVYREASWLQPYIAEQVAAPSTWTQRYLKPLEETATAIGGAIKTGKIKEILESEDVDKLIAKTEQELVDLKKEYSEAASKYSKEDMQGYKPNQMTGYKPYEKTIPSREQVEETEQSLPVNLSDYYYAG